MTAQRAAFGRMIRVCGTIVAAAIAFGPRGAAAPAAQSAAVSGRASNLDRVLDTYVRDGYVYYRALRSDRSSLDAFVASLPEASVESASRDEQLAFWLNAYNAIVLRTVVDHYPIARQRSRDYPARSIRQVPGAFETATHRVAGRSLTLDQIEQTVLAGFGDPRVFFAIGRGAVGSGRLRSEAFTAARLEEQLAGAAAECAARSQCAQVDRPANEVRVSSIFSWREQEFAAVYADRADPMFSARSPIERAALALIVPELLTTEREMIEQNTFRMSFIPFDWTLNDLTGRGGR